MDSRMRSWVTGQADKRDAINDDYFLWPKSDYGIVRVPFKLSKEIREGMPMERSTKSRILLLDALFFSQKKTSLGALWNVKTNISHMKQVEGQIVTVNMITKSTFAALALYQSVRHSL